MGLVDALACPHYDSADRTGIERRDDFQAMMRRSTPA